MTSPSRTVEIEVPYEGVGPLRMREIRMLDGRDRRQRIRFVDIAADGFDAASVGLTGLSANPA